MENVKVGDHVMQNVKIFSEDFQENSPSLVVIALIDMKLYLFKVGEGLKSTHPPPPHPAGLNRVKI